MRKKNRERGQRLGFEVRPKNGPDRASTRPSCKERNQLGQGMTEYILLVALIAIAAIAAVRYFGNKTKEGFEAAADSVGGVTQGMQQGQTANAAGAVVNEVKRSGK